MNGSDKREAAIKIKTSGEIAERGDKMVETKGKRKGARLRKGLGSEKSVFCV